METFDQFDADELYHLGLRASERGQHDEAIALLKKSQSLRPNATTLYILAAEHAEIGMLQRAIEEMEKATEMDPGLWTAHFQRGLLHMMLNQQPEAIDAWSPLLQLSEEQALHHFGSGMTFLLQGNSTEAERFLERGIELNSANPALNEDIRKVLEKIRSSGEAVASSLPESENDTIASIDGITKNSTNNNTDNSTGNGSTGKGHYFLTEYNKDDSEIH